MAWFTGPGAARGGGRRSSGPQDGRHRPAGWLNRISRAAQRYARHTTNESHAEALRFLDRLIAIGGGSPEARLEDVAPARDRAAA